MENIIQKISSILSLIIIFCVTAVFYFEYKGFDYVDGKIIFKAPTAEAAEQRSFATVLDGNIVINASQKYALGSINAPLTLYEYSSLGCPHCSEFHLDVLPKIKKEYVDSGLLRVIFVNFPLDKKSMKAAMISECMTYENYFGFLNRLFDRQRFWFMDNTDDDLFKFAAEYGLTYDETKACMNDNTIAQDIVSNRQEALTRLQVQGTPAFLIRGADGNEIIYGAPSYHQMKEYLDSRLMRY